jgi:hypothetical protein
MSVMQKIAQSGKVVQSNREKSFEGRPCGVRGARNQHMDRL